MNLVKKMNKKIEWLENNEGMGLYVHIPFCTNICTYCDFSKMYYKKEWVDRYLEALKKEIQQYAIDIPVTTIYIGGGTPSSLNEEQQERLLQIVKPYAGNALEYTIEVNPESMTYEKLALFKAYGVNRLSIGVQTFNEVILKKIGRLHHNQEVFELISQAQEIGIKNISIDLMYNLPLQTKEDILKDLMIVETLPITHLSYYSLILEEHTVLYNEHFEGMDEQEEYTITEMIREKLEQFGFHRYEISNFEKDGHLSLHNCVYWLNQHYYGFGLGAHGYLGNTRYNNTKQLSAYLNGEFLHTRETIDQKESMFEALMLGLRLANGISLSLFKQRYQIDLLTYYQERLQPFIDQGLLIIEENHLRPSNNGMDLLDFILLELVD